MMVPEARKMIRLRSGNRLPSSSMKGSERMTERVTAPLGPPIVASRADLATCLLRPLRWLVEGSFSMDSMTQSQTKRTATRIAVMVMMQATRVRLLMLLSFQVVNIARGSCMPRSTNTMPFRVKVITFHTLSVTMFRLEWLGPI